MFQPKVSLLCPAYNHERFVGFFIESVLKQTVQDWELIIVDDCSTDKTVEEIEKFTDPRIRLIKHDFNQGINAGLNDAFELARGQYCVFIASDDMLMPNHLETALCYLDDHADIDVFYCSLALIDDDNNIIEGFEHEFIRTESDRIRLLYAMFFDDNLLLSPGMVVRAKALSKVFPSHLGLLQYQDAALHVELMINGLVYQASDRLVKYRWIRGDKNVSRGSVSQLRQSMEEGVYLDAFLGIKDLSFFKSVFKDELDNLGEPSLETIPYFLGRLALLSKNRERQYWGYRMVCNFMHDKARQNLLYELYGFQFSTYMQLTNYLNVLGSPAAEVNKVLEVNVALRSKIKKYRKICRMFCLLLCIAAFVILTHYMF